MRIDEKNALRKEKARTVSGDEDNLAPTQPKAVTLRKPRSKATITTYAVRKPGMKTIMGKKDEYAYDFNSMASAIKDGLQPTFLDRLQSLIGLSRQELASHVAIPKSTLDRRVREGTRLTPAESERVLRLYRLFKIAAETLGGEDKARAWFTTPNATLGGVTPIAYADTEPGAREVENLLGRVQYGVYS